MLIVTHFLQCKECSAICYSWPEPCLRKGCTEVS